MRTHAPSLVIMLVSSGITAGLCLALQARGRDRQRAAFHAEAAPIVANLRSAFERPLEVLETTGALFEASREVSRSEFARFVKPALERHPGIRALEWIPIVTARDRERYEASARADGLVGFQFKERNAGGVMVRASARGEYMPIYFMEPGHPLVLGFDCTSEPERYASAQRARSTGATVASERIQMLDDPPSAYSIAVFQPVFDPARSRAPENVRGFTCEVFRVRVVAEAAIEDSVRRGVQVTVLDPNASLDKRVLFQTGASLADDSREGFRLDTMFRFADRDWRMVLTTGAHYRSDLTGPVWLVLISGLSLSVLFAFALSAARVIRRLRGQVRAVQQLGQYTLLEKVGEGGVGVVYRARHAMLRRPTAIKLLSQDSHDPQRLARFEREVQLTSGLSHPNTIAIYDYGHTPDGIFYYAMEYIDGITLEDLVRRQGPLPAARVSHLLKQACHAIAEAHAVGLVHRDVKPANLMICRRGGIPDFLKVLDFGLVKEIGTGPAGQERGEAANITLTTATTVVGTPLYLAPEAISRPGEVDGRADLYALGAVAYFLLVGEPVFTGRAIVDVLGHHLHSVPVAPSERAGAAVPASLERIILRCLEKDPADRFQTAGALQAALRAMTDVTAWTDVEGEQWWASHGDRLVLAIRTARAALNSAANRSAVP